MDHVVRVVRLGGAAVGGDGGGAGALEDADVALVEPGAGVLSKDEVTGDYVSCVHHFEGMMGDIHGTLDVGSGVNLVAGLSQKGVYIGISHCRLSYLDLALPWYPVNWQA